MITKEDNTPHMLVATSPSLQEHTVMKFVMEEMGTLERKRLCIRRVMARLPQELQHMSLADKSGLFSNKDALKNLLQQISRPSDPRLIMYRDDHIPWLDEPLWRQEYQDGQHLVTNTETNELIRESGFSPK